MHHRLWIPGPLPGLNDLIDARMVQGGAGRHGKRWNAYSDLKAKWEMRIYTYVTQQRFPRLDGAFYYAYVIREPNKRRDPSNVIAGAVKIIEDGLKGTLKRAQDGWKHVAGIEPYVLEVTKDIPPGVTLYVRQEYRLPVEVELSGDVVDRIRYFEGTTAYEQANRIRVGSGRHEENVRSIRTAPIRGGTVARRRLHPKVGR